MKGTAIIAFPDKGGYNKWKNTADILNEKGFDIEVSQFLENKEYKNGWDLVDLLNYESKNSFYEETKGNPCTKFYNSKQNIVTTQDVTQLFTGNYTLFKLYKGII